jgi:hypothetical protein
MKLMYRSSTRENRPAEKRDDLLLPVFQPPKITDRRAHKLKVEAARRPFAHVPMSDVE